MPVILRELIVQVAEGQVVNFTPVAYSNPNHVVNIFAVQQNNNFPRADTVPLFYLTLLESRTVSGVFFTFEADTNPSTGKGTLVRMRRNSAGAHQAFVYRVRHGNPDPMTIRFLQINESI